MRGLGLSIEGLKKISRDTQDTDAALVPGSYNEAGFILLLLISIVLLNAASTYNDIETGINEEDEEIDENTPSESTPFLSPFQSSIMSQVVTVDLEGTSSILPTTIPIGRNILYLNSVWNIPLSIVFVSLIGILVFLEGEMLIILFSITYILTTMFLFKYPISMDRCI